jgi:acyl-CoA synthetase (NDP forming)
MTDTFEAAYRRIIHPKSIAVVGASNSVNKPGGSVTRNIIENNFTGTLYLVNKSGENVRGMSTYTTVEALPGEIDLGIIVVPGVGVHQAMVELIQKKCKTIIVLTAGFGETDEKGRIEERRLVELAEQHGVTMIGPNCVGIITPHYCGKFAGIVPKMKKGSIDVISASGATVDYLMEQAGVRGLTFDNVITLGNSAHYGVEDVIALLDETHSSEHAPVKFIYIETVKKPQKLLKHARSLTKKGCVLVGIKSGVTDDGSRAAASHTGAMATSDTAVQALFDKAGIIRVRSKYELVEVGCALHGLKNKTNLQKIGIITDAGGPGVMCADELNKYGVSIPRLREATQAKVAGCLPKYATVTNPIDCLPTQTGKQIADVVKVLDDEKEDIDAIVVLTGNSTLFDKWECYSAIAGCMDNGSIPVLPVLSAVTTSADLIDRFKKEGRTYFVEEVNLGSALGKLANRMALYEPENALRNYDKKKIAAILEGCTGVLPARKCIDLLDAVGVGQPKQCIVTNVEELTERAKALAFPVVAKIIGPLHKSEVGGVVVGITNPHELVSAWQRLSRLERFEGVLLQEMIGGAEVIIGANKETGYGHVVMFGLGGIFTEVFKDSQFALAPLGLQESERLIRSIRSFKMLEGVRNQKGMSIAKLADYLTRVSMLVHEFPQISEIDLNPVKGEGEGLSVVDCRIIIENY